MKKLMILIVLCLAVLIASAYAQECKTLPNNLERIVPSGATVQPALMVFDTRPNEAAANAGIRTCDAILTFQKGDSTASMFTEPTLETFRGAMDREARGHGADLSVLSRDERGAYNLKHPKLMLQQQPGDHAVMASGFGLVVTSVEPGSEAAQRQIKPGDWISSINSTIVGSGDVVSVASVNELVTRLRKDGQSVTVTFRTCKPIQSGYVLGDKRDVLVSATD